MIFVFLMRRLDWATNDFPGLSPFFRGLNIEEELLGIIGWPGSPAAQGALGSSLEQSGDSVPRGVVVKVGNSEEALGRLGDISGEHLQFDRLA